MTDWEKMLREAPDMGQQWRDTEYDEAIDTIERLSVKNMDLGVPLDVLVFAAVSSSLDWSRGKKLEVRHKDLIDRWEKTRECNAADAASEITQDNIVVSILRWSLPLLLTFPDPGKVFRTVAQVVIDVVALNPRLCDKETRH